MEPHIIYVEMPEGSVDYLPPETIISIDSKGPNN
jgi:hypothetical protein